jgi:hypothetical protein
MDDSLYIQWSRYFKILLEDYNAYERISIKLRIYIVTK